VKELKLFPRYLPHRPFGLGPHGSAKTVGLLEHSLACSNCLSMFNSIEMAMFETAYVQSPGTDEN
jgi:hypothetical protein